MLHHSLNRWPALLVTVLLSSTPSACNMNSLPRNMDLKAFDPHRADFVCKYEADANPPISQEAEALFQHGMAVTGYEFAYPVDKRDYAQAAALWKQAADKGHWKAALNLAGLYEQGLGVERDTEKAVLLVEGQMTRGVPAAFDKMGTYHLRGIGVKDDASRAYALWQLAADMGSSAAQAFLGSKTSGTYDLPGQGFWGNRKVGLQMLECSYAQGNSEGAFQLGLTINGDNKALGEDHDRALRVFHDAVKFGSAESAGYLSSAFRAIEPLTGNTIDTSRADRYRQLRGALERNRDLRLPNLDKVLPLPPAELPLWDGKPQTLIDAAKPLVRLPPVQPTPGSERTGRAHIPQGYGLARDPLPPVAERKPLPQHHHGQFILEPPDEQDVVPYSGYWLAKVKEYGRAFQSEWNARQVPVRYAQGERFEPSDRRSMGEYARFNPPKWYYLGEAVKLAGPPPHIKVAQRIARNTRSPEPPVQSIGSAPCPRTGVWEAHVPAEHPRAKVYNIWERVQAYVEAGECFPSPIAQGLDIEPQQVQWRWLDNANQPKPNGVVHVTLTDLHDGRKA